jgi:four helix bundle protein
MDLQERTKQFALRVIRLLDSLPERHRTSDIIAKQLLRSATSVGANYRAACRGRSAAEFRAKLGIVEEELDESIYWIEMLVGANITKQDLVAPLLDEANQILAMVVASIRTSRGEAKPTNGFANPHSEIRTPHSEERSC